MKHSKVNLLMNFLIYKMFPLFCHNKLLQVLYQLEESKPKETIPLLKIEKINRFILLLKIFKSVLLVLYCKLIYSLKFIVLLVFNSKGNSF